MTLSDRVEAKPAALLDAIGELALAIKPHNMDHDQRQRIALAIGTLVTHVIDAADLRARKEA